MGHVLPLAHPPAQELGAPIAESFSEQGGAATLGGAADTSA